MAHKIGSLIKETASAGGTADFTLAGAQATFNAFSSLLATGDTTWYFARNGSEFESGLGTFTAPSTLARTRVLESSNANGLVNFSTAPTVYCEVPAANLLLVRPAGPDDRPPAPNPADDEFEEAALDTTGSRRTGATPWVWVNQGAATATVAKGSLVLSAPVNNPTGDNHRFVAQALPTSGTWKYRAKIAADWALWSTASVSLGLYNSGAGKLVTVGKMLDASNARHVYVSKYNSLTSYNSNYFVDSSLWIERLGALVLPHYFEFEWDGTNYHARVSATGVDGTFTELASFTPADFLGTADKIFLGIDPGSAGTTLICDWFRRIA